MLVGKAHGFTTDTLLLADFSMPVRGEACADFGTGCGTIPLLWAARGNPRAVWGIEIQEEAAAMAAESAAESGVDKLVTVLRGDVREIKGLLPHGSLDMVACNPPYQAVGAGRPSPMAARALARHEGTLSLEELARAANYVLRYGGCLCICLRVQRLAQAIQVFGAAGLEPKRLRLVQQRAGKPPYLFLLECRRGGKPGLEADPVLLLEGADGKPTAELEKIYGDYRDGAGGK